MRRPCGRGQKAATELVFALCAGLEPLKAQRDTMLDGGVITDLEVQAVKFLAATPVPPVQGVSPAQVKGPRDVAALMFSQQQHDVIGHRPPDFLEKPRGQGGDTAAFEKG